MGCLNLSPTFAPRSDPHGSEADNVKWCWLPVDTCFGSFREWRRNNWIYSLFITEIFFDIIF